MRDLLTSKDGSLALHKELISGGVVSISLVLFGMWGEKWGGGMRIWGDRGAGLARATQCVKCII